MLTTGSSLINTPVLSLHIGGEIAQTVQPVIDPENLTIIAYTIDGPLLDDPEVGDILMTQDIRDVSPEGFIVDSTDRLTRRSEVVKLDKIMQLNFDLVGLKVVTQDGKKLGKVVDYTVDLSTFSVFQLIVQRPVMASFIDPQLTINRSQIVEVDDYKITIKHDKEQVKLAPKSKKQAEAEEFVPNFTNPFRKPTYSSEDSASKTSE